MIEIFENKRQEKENNFRLTKTGYKNQFGSQLGRSLIYSICFFKFNACSDSQSVHNELDSVYLPSENNEILGIEDVSVQDE